MNKPTVNIIIIFLIFCSVVGCSKKDHTNAPPGQPGIANLVKQTVIVYHRSGLDFSTYSDYIYDAQDKVTSFRQYQTNVGINEVDTFHSFIFQYANNETLPSGSQEKFMNDWSEYDVVTHQYEYDNQNRLV